MFLCVNVFVILFVVYSCYSHGYTFIYLCFDDWHITVYFPRYVIFLSTLMFNLCLKFSFCFVCYISGFNQQYCIKISVLRRKYRHAQTSHAFRLYLLPFSHNNILR